MPHWRIRLTSHAIFHRSHEYKTSQIYEPSCTSPSLLVLAPKMLIYCFLESEKRWPWESSIICNRPMLAILHCGHTHSRIRDARRVIAHHVPYILGILVLCGRRENHIKKSVYYNDLDYNILTTLVYEYSESLELFWVWATLTITEVLAQATQISSHIPILFLRGNFVCNIILLT